MKHLKQMKRIPLLFAAAGLAALGIRKGLYTAAVDGTGRLVSGHPLSLALLCLCLGIAMLTALVFFCTKNGPQRRSGLPCLAGALAFSLGIVLTLPGGAVMAGNLGLVWTVLGWVSVPCLAAAGFARFRDRKPFFLLTMAPAVFLTAHLVCHYQLWCSNPQILDILFPLLSTVCLIIAAFQRSALEEDAGSRPQLIAAGYLGLFCCLAELAQSQYPWLYLGGAVWLAGLLWEEGAV